MRRGREKESRIIVSRGANEERGERRTEEVVELVDLYGEAEADEIEDEEDDCGSGARFWTRASGYR